MRSALSGRRISVTCCKQSWLLRDVPASEWIANTLTPDMSGVFPGLVRGRDAERLFDLWLDVPDMQRRCINVARVALGRASGREWIWAYNLIREASASWVHLNGSLIREGVDVDKVRLDHWMDAAFTVFMERLEDKAKAGFEARLRMVPKGIGGPRPAMSSKSDLLAFALD